MVGVIASLARYFALHTLFAGTRPVQLGPLGSRFRCWSSVDPLAVTITVLALVLIFWRRWSPLRTIGACAALGAIIGIVRLVAG